MLTDPKNLSEAVDELARTIAPHNMDRGQREKIAKALHVLVNHILVGAGVVVKK